jgi:membrane-associated phospholipid phosphatase
VSSAIKPPFFSLPDRTRLRTCFIYGSLQTVWFWIVYGGCNWITSQRQDLVRVHFAFEENWPFVPDLIWVYSSIYLLFISIPFILDTPRRLVMTATAMAMATGLAGICFLLLPAEPDFTTPDHLGLIPSVFQLSDWINLNYNQVPSLHVAFVVICAESFCLSARVIGKAVLRSWQVAVAVAAVLTYQHHLVDVVAGYGLGLTCLWSARRGWFIKL